MRLRPTLFLLHRWISVIVSVQLLAWSCGGFIFSVLQLNDVRGRSDAAEKLLHTLPITPPLTSMETALAVARENLQQTPIGHIALEHRLDKLVYGVYETEGKQLLLIDAQTGQPLPEITKSEAGVIALHDFKHSTNIVSIEYLDASMKEAGTVPGEFRGRSLPAYKVVLDHEREPHLYIDALSGKVVARRNDLWRVFDFFWMLHIMDYDERENFNHPLLVVASGFAVLSAFSGLVLWGFRLPRLWRRKRSPK